MALSRLAPRVAQREGPHIQHRVALTDGKVRFEGRPMAEQRKRRSPWPRPTLLSIFFVTGRMCGALEVLAQGFTDEPASLGGTWTARLKALQENIDEASFWPQRQALAKLCPLFDELNAVYQEMNQLIGGDQPMPSAVQQLEEQLRRLLPPDVRF